MYNKIKLLDCTLRDGGYITDWNWGYSKSTDIIKSLVKSNVDIVEVGFLRNVDGYKEDVTVCNKIEELNRLLPEEKGKCMFSAMAMQSNYDIDKLSDYSGSGIEMIRVTAHDYDIEDGLKFAERVKEKGYKVSINPINIMGYSDENILYLTERVNEILPYQFSIVDTFGSMKRRDLDRIVSMVDNNLDKGIRLGLHLHENMAQSFSLAQMMIDKHISRHCTIDGSLLGIGRTPGNLPIELIADYMNEYCDSHYDIDYMMDAIQDYIAEIKGDSKWGYSPAYFLSAKFNLHRNYAEHYLNKGNLTIRDINHILARIEQTKVSAFDKEYADKLYAEYMNHNIDDGETRKKLQGEIGDRNILIIAPGMSVLEYTDIIKKKIEQDDCCVISLNFMPSNIKADYAFFSNNKRISKIDKHNCKVIATSNLESDIIDYYVDYNSLTIAHKQGNNSLLQLLQLLKQFEISKVTLAGADGFMPSKQNYYDPTIIGARRMDRNYNEFVGRALLESGMELTFLTPSKYEVYFRLEKR